MTSGNGDDGDITSNEEIARFLFVYLDENLFFYQSAFISHVYSKDWGDDNAACSASC